MGESAANALRKYELVVILHPDTSEQDQKEFFRKTRDIVQSFAGTVHSLDTWGKRRLANAIDRLTRGHYFHMTFEAAGNAVAELERTMRINDQVLRFQTTRIDDRMSLAKYMEHFKDALQETLNREREREIKNQQRKAMRAEGAPRPRA